MSPGLEHRVVRPGPRGLGRRGWTGLCKGTEPLVSRVSARPGCHGSRRRDGQVTAGQQLDPTVFLGMDLLFLPTELPSAHHP